MKESDLKALPQNDLRRRGLAWLIRQALRNRDGFKPDIWSNPIHAEDVARVVAFLTERELWPETLLVSDDRPALRGEIFEWVRAETGQPRGLFDEDHSVRGRNRGNKRIANRRLREMGVELPWPGYPVGLAPLPFKR